MKLERKKVGEEKLGKNTGCSKYSGAFERLPSAISKDLTRLNAHQIGALCWLICLKMVLCPSEVTYEAERVRSIKSFL